MLVVHRLTLIGLLCADSWFGFGAAAPKQSPWLKTFDIWGDIDATDDANGGDGRAVVVSNDNIGDDGYAEIIGTAVQYNNRNNNNNNNNETGWREQQQQQLQRDGRGKWTMHAKHNGTYSIRLPATSACVANIIPHPFDGLIVLIRDALIGR